ncbi:outer membrane usher protein [Rahnella laticis]|uniref:outer membrane usher protein n=1 Tax=Rahnella laticis TaxID=2787622 RepID=UPI0018A28020|nr:outer membrane usher protein [Rahnella laticis]MBF7993686.1 outer membrane usher protein [Rahnella laticis]
MDIVVTKHKRAVLSLLICLALGNVITAAHSEETNFNVDFLDANDRTRIDLNKFSKENYVVPGQYVMVIKINENITLSEQNIDFFAPDNNTDGSSPCLTHDIVAQFGLREGVSDKLTWWHKGQCLDVTSLKDSKLESTFNHSSIILSIPQAYLEYTSKNWDPPSRWDNGIAGVLLDYNINADTTDNRGRGQTQTVSGVGTVGANMGPWRLRADWSEQYSHTTGKAESRQQFEWNRYYMYRAIASLKAKLTLGDDYLQSNIFDSFQYAGASLATDDDMLPPNLRGYSPEISGIARTNAKVTVSQLGRVIYTTQVAPGPFSIQDISQTVTGVLDVKVQESDGSVQQFQVNTSNVPYLTRPGTVRYKLALGKPTDYQHKTQGPTFTSGEFSWGVANGWSLYGGAILAGAYNALSAGIGRDLLSLGALSLDVTQSLARDLPQTEKNLTGGSYRISYSKNFDQYDTQVTFAGYRFSQRNFMSMSDYLSARYAGRNLNNSKELYTIMMNKQFRDLGLSFYMNYDHQTYWNKPDSDRYTMSLARYFDLFSIKNISLSMSAFYSTYEKKKDKGLYVSVNVPFGASGTVTYSGNSASGQTTQQVAYNDSFNEQRGNYSVYAGGGQQGGSGGGNVSYDGDQAKIGANLAYQGGQYTTAGLSLQGGMTATAKGAALHRVNKVGAARLLVDTGDVSGVPVSGNGNETTTNHFGKAVIADVNDYYRNQASIDLDKLPKDADAVDSVTSITLTEGAIGYRRFDVISGQKVMAIIRLADGSYPPFAATVKNSNQQQTGIVTDDGAVYLTGVNPSAKMSVSWDGKEQCQVTIPAGGVNQTSISSLLLPCEPVQGPES